MAVISRGQLTLSDLNDAIISGTPPTNPTVDTLWIDSSVTPNLLKRWSGSAWVNMGEISTVGTGTTITQITQTLGNMANDNILDYQERQIVKDKLTEILGYVIADNITALPTVATLDSSLKGGLYTVRKSALNAGILATNPLYIAVATHYTNLKNYLDGLTPIKPWNIATANQSTNITVVKDTFRTNWLNYYVAVDALAVETSRLLKLATDNVDGRLTTVQTSLQTAINQSNSQIALKANQTTVDTLANRVSTAESQITVQAGEINLKVSQTDVRNTLNGLDLGGRNFVVNSDFNNNFTTWDNWGTATRNVQTVNGKKWARLTQNDTGQLRGIAQRIPLAGGVTYTLSFKGYKVSGGRLFIVLHYRNGWNIVDQTNQHFNVTNTAQTFHFTFTTSATADNLYLMVGGENGVAMDLLVTELKIEKGVPPTTPTVWTPAQEDFASGTNIVSMINQTAETIKIQASKISLVGAVTVLSDITGNLGSITAGTITGTTIRGTNIYGSTIEGSTVRSSDTTNFWDANFTNRAGFSSGEFHLESKSLIGVATLTLNGSGINMAGDNEFISYPTGVFGTPNASIRYGTFGVETFAKSNQQSMYYINANRIGFGGSLGEWAIFTGDWYTGTMNLTTDKLTVSGKFACHSMENLELRWNSGTPFIDFSNNSSIDYDSRLILQSTNILRVEKSHFYVGAMFNCWGTWSNTISAGANLAIHSDGTFYRIASASKYKLCIEPIPQIDEYSNKILNLTPKHWFDRHASEKYSQYLTDKKNGKTWDKEGLEAIPHVERHAGLIAEDLIDVGLEQYVSYGDLKEDGTREPEGIQYDRLWTLLIPIVKRNKEEIELLKLENQNLRERLDNI